MEEFLCWALELEQTRVAVREEMRERDKQIVYLRDLLNRIVREREEVREKGKKLLIQMLLLQKKKEMMMIHLSGISSIEDELRREIDSNNGLSRTECEESFVSSPVMVSISQPHLPPPRPPLVSVPQKTLELRHEKQLPEKGKLLQAVANAGPLLHTLLLAGPLPQWRHTPPPPPPQSFIPSSTVPSPPPQQLPHQNPSTKYEQVQWKDNLISNQTVSDGNFFK